MRFTGTRVWLLEGGINKVSARFLGFLGSFSAFFSADFGGFFACPSSSWRIGKVIYGAHDGHLNQTNDGSEKEQESLLPHKNCR